MENIMSAATEIAKTIKMTVEKPSALAVTAYAATVKEVNGNKASVCLAGENSVIDNLLNKTGEELFVGDCVYLFKVGKQLSNAYIAVKFA